MTAPEPAPPPTEPAPPAAEPPVAPPGMIGRVGMAVVAPRWALAVADTAGEPGRSGTDLVRLLGVLLLSVHTRRLVAAGWLAAAVGVVAGLRGAAAVLSQALTTDLAFLVGATVILWLASGRRRSLGRAFDQVCVAAVPLVAVELVASTLVRGADLAVPRPVGLALTGLAFGWAGALVTLGWRQLRTAPPRSVPVPPVVAVRGRIAGWALGAVAAASLAINAIWIARNADLLRPMAPGDPAPGFALPEIDRDGHPGAPVELGSLRGKLVVVDFWATWCQPCIDSLPRLSALRTQLAAGGEVLAVNLDDPVRARKLVDASAPAVRLLYDDHQQVAARYGVGPVPHTVVIDAAGRVRGVIRGGDGDLAALVAAAR